MNPIKKTIDSKILNVLKSKTKKSTKIKMSDIFIIKKPSTK